MKKLTSAAIVTAATAQVVLPDFEAELPRRHLASGLDIIDNQDACDELESGDLSWYDYEWNADGCYCEHVWNLNRGMEAPTGEQLNPFYEAYSAVNKYIT